MKKILYDASIEHGILDVVDRLPGVCALRFGKTLSKIVLRNNILKVFAVAYLAKDYDIVAPDWYGYGRLLSLLMAILHQKKIVFVEFIDYNPANKNALVAFIYNLYIKLILAPSMRRSVLGLHVMTPWEKDRYRQLYRLPENAVRYIRWPIAGWSEPSSTMQAGNGSVFSAGRAACDWDTLFAAARLGKWPLTVVCSKKDLPHVLELNKTVGAKVYSEIAVSEHDQLMAQASVCVICLKESNKSSGHIRLGSCITLGVPSVVTAVKGMDGYLIDGVTGCSVPPNDPEAIFRIVTGLLDDRNFAQKVVENGRNFVASYNKDHYIRRVKAMLMQEPDPSETII